MRAPDVEGLTWVKARASNNTNNCVEIARNHDDTILIRDSKDRGGARLRFERTAWEAFRAGLRAGKLGLPG
jgi:hypothetical protein